MHTNKKSVAKLRVYNENKYIIKIRQVILFSNIPNSIFARMFDAFSPFFFHFHIVAVVAIVIIFLSRLAEHMILYDLNWESS